MINEINLEQNINVILKKFCSNSEFNKLYEEVYELKEERKCDNVLCFGKQYLSDYDKLWIIEGEMYDSSIQNLIKKRIDLNQFFKNSKYFQTFILELDATIERCGTKYFFINNIESSLSYIEQQNIIPILREAFPEIHFVILTDSVFVLQSCKKQELIIPKDKKELFSIDEHPYLLGIEELLKEFFDMRDQIRSKTFIEMEKSAEEYFIAIKNKTETIEELQERYKKLSLKYSEDPAYCALLKSELPIK